MTAPSESRETIVGRVTLQIYADYKNRQISMLEFFAKLNEIVRDTAS